jgi:four helix bundle protein
MDKPHKRLLVWQKAVELCVLMYEVTERFPKQEMFGLISQMRRAALSVASNLAEGSARIFKKELHQFINIARGSLSELDTQVEIAARLGFIPEVKKNQVDALMSEVDRLLYGFLKSVKRQVKEGGGEIAR